MDEETKKTLAERFDALPKSVQEVITSSHYEESLVEISKKHDLSIEQMGALEIETTMVMMGLAPAKDFARNIEKQLKIETGKAYEIEKEINEKVFLRIKDLLKLMNTPPGEEPHLDEASTASTPTPKPELTAHEAEAQHIETREEILKRLEQPEIAAPAAELVHPIVAEKLTAPTKSTPANTNHELSNVNSSPNPISYPGGADPYRMPPE